MESDLQPRRFVYWYYVYCIHIYIDKHKNVGNRKQRMFNLSIEISEYVPVFCITPFGPEYVKEYFPVFV